ncbi:hypothetical protein DMUE_3558 [Dictyocoela muelleri]|nr:hypothetical protein DMUE_3558 [Dictyocoela muelleri]
MLIFSLHNNIYHNNQKALEFLIENDIINDTSECSCGQNMTLCINKRNEKEVILYRCTNIRCRKRKSIFKQTIFERSRLDLFDILLLLNFFLHDIRNYSVENFSGLCKPTYVEYKKFFIFLIKQITQDNIFLISGSNRRVQVDETAIARGRLITNPSNSYDEISNVVWLLGGIEEDGEERCFLEIIPNRQRTTLSVVLRNKIANNTVLITDEHPSYPGAASDLEYQHIVVNHSEGFTNQYGDHTNKIENLWSHLKNSMRNRHEIQYENWKDFVAEFAFRRNYLRDHSEESFRRVFILILKKAFNN